MAVLRPEPTKPFFKHRSSVTDNPMMGIIIIIMIIVVILVVMVVAVKAYRKLNQRTGGYLFSTFCKYSRKLQSLPSFQVRNRCTMT